MRDPDSGKHPAPDDNSIISHPEPEDRNAVFQILYINPKMDKADVRTFHRYSPPLPVLRVFFIIFFYTDSMLQ
jgi:hypothetical protein